MNRPMKIALLGATGKAGKYILNQLLTQQYRVKALIRRPDTYKFTHPLLEIVPGDGADADSIRQLIEGCDAVISTLGQRVNEPLVTTPATQHIIAAMEAHGISRYIFVAGLNLDVPGDKKSEINIAKSEWMKQHYPEVVADKQNAFNIISNTHLNWTMVRVPMIEESSQKRQLKVDLQDCPGENITTADLAAFVVAQLTSDEYNRKAPSVASY